MTSVHLPFCFRYIDLLLCRVWHLCDLPCGVYALFRLISIGKYVFKSLSVGFKFQGQSLKYSVSTFQRKVDNWKPQAGGHIFLDTAISPSEARSVGSVACVAGGIRAGERRRSRGHIPSRASSVRDLASGEPDPLTASPPAFTASLHQNKSTRTRNPAN